jgi:leader peptidase (prepilin peptidase)/N-methyltransferase
MNVAGGALIGQAVFDAHTWEVLPFHFWTVVFFVFGTVVGSFLNVCIHRMPLGLSLVHPPSRCPHCGGGIAWRHNIPIFGWLFLRGRCANPECRMPISPRYVLVEALTGLCFAAVWVFHGTSGPLASISLCIFAAGLIVATFIDLEHLIIPDEITLGGAVLGLILSVVAPGIHGVEYAWPSMKTAFIGAALGSGIVFAMLELGKVLFGRQRLAWTGDVRITFTESDLHLPDAVLPYEDIFYRVSDTLKFQAKRLELVDRCYWDVPVQLRLRGNVLRIGEEQIEAATVPWLQATTDTVLVPREAMGFGDVKFMAAIGAFTGWEGVLFTLLGSSLVGLAVNVGLILIGRRQWSARIPFGPYLAAAALGWVLGGKSLFLAWMAATGVRL